MLEVSDSVPYIGTKHIFKVQMYVFVVYFKKSKTNKSKVVPAYLYSDFYCTAMIS